MKFACDQVDDEASEGEEEENEEGEENQLLMLGEESMYNTTTMG